MRLVLEKVKKHARDKLLKTVTRTEALLQRHFLSRPSNPGSLRARVRDGVLARAI
jgi:hypothetical protein